MDALSVFLIASIDKKLRPAVMEQALMAALPGPSSQRLAVAALSAEQQLKRQAVTEENLLKEAIDAAKFDAPEQLRDFQALQAVFNRLSPTAQVEIFKRPEPPTPSVGS